MNYSSEALIITLLYPMLRAMRLNLSFGRMHYSAKCYHDQKRGGREGTQRKVRSLYQLAHLYNVSKWRSSDDEQQWPWEKKHYHWSAVSYRDTYRALVHPVLRSHTHFANFPNPVFPPRRLAALVSRHTAWEDSMHTEYSCTKLRKQSE